MESVKKISVIIPCYNEEESIVGVINKIRKDETEIIVVDNNCTDKTARFATESGARVIVEKCPGYGAAIKCGLNSANGDILVVLDGDGQYPAEEIPAAIDYLVSNNLDFISCSRFPLRDKRSLPFVRRFGNKLFNLAANVLFNLRLKDSQSGMWVFKSSVLNKINLESDGMPLSEEIKIKVLKNKELKFKEYSINYYERIGESKLFPLKHGFINLLYLLKLRIKI